MTFTWDTERASECTRMEGHAFSENTAKAKGGEQEVRADAKRGTS